MPFELVCWVAREARLVIRRPDSNVSKTRATNRRGLLQDPEWRRGPIAGSSRPVRAWDGASPPCISRPSSSRGLRELPPRVDEQGHRVDPWSVPSTPDNRFESTDPWKAFVESTIDDIDERNVPRHSVLSCSHPRRVRPVADPGPSPGPGPSTSLRHGLLRLRSESKRVPSEFRGLQLQ